jgi:heparanase 1
LVKALAPADLRLGGSEADKTYYDLRAIGRAPTVPPGYESAMSQAQWDAAQAFAARNDLAIVFCLNAGPSARDRHGRWRPDNAAELLAYTAHRDYPIAVWELGNELNILWAVHGLQTQMSPRQYAEDLRRARGLLEEYTLDARLAGQGSAFWPVLGEPLGPFFGFLPEILGQAGDVVDLVGWHYYPQQSHRGPILSTVESTQPWLPLHATRKVRTSSSGSSMGWARFSMRAQ